MHANIHKAFVLFPGSLGSDLTIAQPRCRADQPTPLLQKCNRT